MLANYSVSNRGTMQILLFGKPNSITSTIAEMLNSRQDWTITIVTSAQESISVSRTNEDDTPSYDVIIGNLGGFSRKPSELVRALRQQFPDCPLLILYSYRNPMLIRPLLDAGADGYLQNGHSEEDVFDAVQTVAAGSRYLNPYFNYEQ